jgi:TPR repeat protein
MVESSRQVQISDPYQRFDEAINDPRLYPAQPYQRPESTQLEPLPHDRVPLFLSDYDQQYEEEQYDDQPHYTFGSKQPKSYTGRIVSGVVAASAAAAIVGLFAMDATRSVLIEAKASLASMAPASFSGTPAEPAAQPAVQPAAPPPQRVAQPAAAEPRIAAPDAQAVYRSSRPSEQLPANVADAQASIRKPADKPTDLAYAAGTPSREEIAAALQSAAKSRVVASAEPTAPIAPAPAAPSARRMDADELAALLKRAKGLLAVGDIASARLLLERAADAQESEAALMLATTYDPQVLGTQDMRSITPDPAMARAWYQKAAKLGSADALRRLQTQN